MMESVDEPHRVESPENHVKFEDTYLALALRQTAPIIRRVVVVWSVVVLGVPALVLMLRAARALDARLTKRSAPETMPVSQPPMPQVQSHHKPPAPIRQPESVRTSIPSGVPPDPATSHRSSGLLAPSPVEKPAPARAVNVIIPAGRMLTVVLSEDLATDTNHEGDVFHAVLMEDLESEGRVVAAAKSNVRGRIVALRQGDGTENPRFTLALESLDGVSGPVSLNTDQLAVEGRRQSKFKRILGGVTGAIANEVDGKRGEARRVEVEPIMAMRGDVLTLPAESIVRFSLQKDLAVFAGR